MIRNEMDDEKQEAISHAPPSATDSAGDQADSRIDPIVEENYWRKRFSARPYVVLGSSYEDYGPAYEYGWTSYPRHAGKAFHEVDGDLRHVWESVKGKSKLTWSLAKHAVRDAWDRLARNH
jgi:hypothetical protein